MPPSFPNTKEGLKAWKAYMKTIDPKKGAKAYKRTMANLKKQGYVK